MPAGLDYKLYRNTGTYGSPTWTLVGAAINVKRLRATAEIEGKSRLSYWLRRKRGHKTIGIEFSLLRESAEETAYAAIRTAWLNRSSVEFAVANAAIATAGTIYERLTCGVFKFEESQDEDGLVMADCVAKLIRSANDPSKATVGS